jgi:predicted anti-sigma-YlaC factor YlaD
VTASRLLIALGLAGAVACSPKKLAVNALGNAIASGSGSSFASDEDPELVGDAVPFALKTIESLLASSPRHRPLLEAAASGFVQYAFVWVENEADLVEEEDLERATAQRARAIRLYLRGRDYALRGLDLRSPGLGAGLLRSDRAAAEKALATADRRDVPFLYWAAAGWGSAISLATNDPELNSGLGAVEALARRGLALDEAWDRGALHAVLMALEASRASVGGSMERAREHFERAKALQAGAPRAFLLVSYAESLAVPAQDRAGFEAALREALAVDVDRLPAERLANVVAQQRARWLLGRVDELFFE